jgi:hypothetical protein
VSRDIDAVDAYLASIRRPSSAEVNLAGKVLSAGSTRLPIQRVPEEYDDNLSTQLAYAIGRHSHALEKHINPYPQGTRQAQAWDAGRAQR